MLKCGPYTVTVNKNKILKHFLKKSHAENPVFKKLPLMGLFETFDMLVRIGVWVKNSWEFFSYISCCNYLQVNLLYSTK